MCPCQLLARRRGPSLVSKFPQQTKPLLYFAGTVEQSFSTLHVPVRVCLDLLSRVNVATRSSELAYLVCSQDNFKEFTVSFLEQNGDVFQHSRSFPVVCLISIISEEGSWSCQVFMMMMSRMTIRLQEVPPVTLLCVVHLLLPLRASNSCVLEQACQLVVLFTPWRCQMFVLRPVASLLKAGVFRRQIPLASRPQVRESLWLGIANRDMHAAPRRNTDVSDRQQRRLALSHR